MTLDDGAVRNALVRLEELIDLCAKSSAGTLTMDLRIEPLAREVLSLLQPTADPPDEVSQDAEPGTLVALCTIQDGCIYPLGHMGNCNVEVPAGYLLRKACAPHNWTEFPENHHSGNLSYEICPRCHCVQEHPVHRWKPPVVNGDRIYLKGQTALSDYPEHPAAPTVESVDFLLARIALVIPEPSLMDVEDGGASQSLLLLRTQTIAQLHQAKQLDRIAGHTEGIETAIAYGCLILREAISAHKPSASDVDSKVLCPECNGPMKEKSRFPYVGDCDDPGWQIGDVLVQCQKCKNIELVSGKA